MGPDTVPSGGGDGGVTGEVAPAVSSAVETSAAPTAVESASSPAPVETSAVAAPSDASAAEVAPAAEVAKEAPKPEPSLLSEAGKEVPKVDGETPAEAPPAKTPAVELPTYEAFALPEGVEIKDAAQMKAFTDILGEFELQAKIPHELAQEMGQKFMDLYVSAAQKMQAEAAQAQTQVWNDTRKAWVDEIKNDPLIGRNRFETSLADAVLVRDMFATEKTTEMMNYTGAGDHPGMMQFMCNVAKYLHKHGLLREGTPVVAPAAKAANPTGKGGQRNRYSASASKGA